MRIALQYLHIDIIDFVRDTELNRSSLRAAAKARGY
jgi:hypothetical protein